jgi:hypothetical protein
MMGLFVISRRALSSFRSAPSSRLHTTTRMPASALATARTCRTSRFDKTVEVIGRYAVDPHKKSSSLHPEYVLSRPCFTPRRKPCDTCLSISAYKNSAATISARTAARMSPSHAAMASFVARSSRSACARPTASSPPVFSGCAVMLFSLTQQPVFLFCSCRVKRQQAAVSSTMAVERDHRVRDAILPDEVVHSVERSSGRSRNQSGCSVDFLPSRRKA